MLERLERDWIVLKKSWLLMEEKGLGIRVSSVGRLGPFYMTILIDDEESS